MNSISQPNNNASAWVRVNGGGQIRDARILLDANGRMMLIGIESYERAALMYYAYMNLGEENFSSLKTLPVGFNGQGQQGKKLGNFRLVQGGASSIQICAQDTEGAVYSKYLGPDNASVNQWLPLINLEKCKDNQWGLTHIDDNSFYLFGLVRGGNKASYAIVPYKMGPTAPTFGSIATNNMLTIRGIRGSSGDLVVVGEENGSTFREWSTANLGHPNSYTMSGVMTQIVRLTNGVLLQFNQCGDGNIRGYSQADSLSPLSSEITIPAQSSTFKLVTDSLGVPSIFAHWYDGSIKMCTGNGPNGAFTDWQTISEPKVPVVSMDVARDFYGGFRVLVTLDNKEMFMCSTIVDDRVGALNDSKAPAKQQMQSMQALTSQITFKTGNLWNKSEVGDQADLASPVIGALKEISGYKDILIHWLKDLATTIGKEGFKLLMDADSLGKTMKSHLHFNDFKPNTALDFLEPKDIRKFIDKGISTFENKAGAPDYKEKLISEFTSLVNHLKTLTTLLNMPMPLNVHQLETHTLPLLKTLPEQVVEHLSRLFPNPDFSKLEDAVNAMSADIAAKTRSNGGSNSNDYKLETLFSTKTIRIMAGASAICSVAASIITIVTKSLPLKLGLGINFVVAATAKGRAVAEVDVSGGVDAGVGVSIPILGIGVFAGAGAGNGTLVKVDVIWIGLTPALLCPFSALCLSANTILEGMISSNKQYVHA